MPEYLSPGVYVEEIPAGNQPIEGVSTSTVGLVGVTERGPVNMPQLITSYPEYTRTFGGSLPYDDFLNGSRAHCYLPYAVEGFFTNGGKRAWITRVVPRDVEFADRDMFFADPAAVNVGSTITLRPAQEGSGTTAAPPALYVLDATNLADKDWIRIGAGSHSEYRQVDGAPVNQQRHVALDSPIRNGHAAGSAVRALAVAPDAGLANAVFALAADVAKGNTELVLKTGDVAGLITALPAGTAPNKWKLLEIGKTAVADYIYATRAVADTTAGQARVTLARPLNGAYSPGLQVTAIVSTGGTDDTLSLPANSGAALAFITTSPLPADFKDDSHVIIFEPTTANQEASSIGVLATLPLTVPTYGPYPAGTVGVHVIVLSDDHNVTGVPTANSVIKLDDVSHLSAGMTLTFIKGALTQNAIIASIDTTASTVTLQVSLPWAPTKAQTIAKTLTAPANAGGTSIALNDRLGLEVGDVVRVGGDELVTIRSFSGDRGAAPDAGSVLLQQPLGNAYPASTTVQRQVVNADPNYQPIYAVIDAAAGASQLLVTNGTSFNAGDDVQFTKPDGSQAIHQLSAASVKASPSEIRVVGSLNFNHPAGQPVIERETLFEVRAIDAGDWGNRLLIAARDETSGLVSNASVVNATPPPDPGLFSSLQLTTLTGVEPGTILEMLDPSGASIPGLALLKVRRVDRTTRVATLDMPGLVAAHMTAVGNAALLGQQVRVRSREFSLTVMLRQRPDPSTPSRDDNLLDQETFRWLSMDPRHSRYIERIIGVTYTPGSDTDDNGDPVRRSDRRSEGSSEYIRVDDLAPDANRQAIRLGPETLVDVMPSGLIRPARLPLFGGDDNVLGMDDAMYVGTDDTEPRHRTGLFTLKNPQFVSLVAIPGQVTPVVQQSVIDQCEDLRYRFAVLDGPPPDDDTVVDVQQYRQQFDSNYAALYHPWLTIPDPYPSSPALVRQFAIPPCGHVLGIYARVDNDRGVHKAPANEVVRGITGMTRYFAKGEQDILNPYPVNINVIRDFRSNDRGIRVWGARCITSEPEDKYVNVRRLLIFLENSIDIGLQSVVFEPNAEPLWATVRRSVTNFLTTVWRNGALEGDTPAQGFFVKCDRTTMTEDDFDNGRLIVVCGVAPVKPAEFVIFRIGLWTADAQQ